MASSRSALAAGLLIAAATSCFGGGSYTPVQTAFNRGVYLDAKGDYDGAIAQYRIALEVDPGDDRARFNLATCYEQRADRLAAAGQSAGAAEWTDRAAREYRALLERDPDHPRASVNLAALSYDADPEQGKAMLEDLIERYPDRVRPRAALGARLLNEKKPVEAAIVLKAAHELEPGGLEVSYLLAEAYAGLGERGKAQELLLGVLDDGDPDLAVLMALARLELAADEVTEVELAAASSYLWRVVLIDPDHFEAHRLLAEVYERQGDAEQATEHLWWARRLRPEEIDDEATSRRLLELYGRLIEVEQRRLSAGGGPDKQR